MTNWFPEALDVLYALADLKPNLDGEGELPITDEAISNAMRLLYRLDRRGVRRPFIHLSRDGSVQLEWEGGDNYLEIECYPEHYAYLFCNGRTESPGRTDDPVALVIDKLGQFN